MLLLSTETHCLLLLHVSHLLFLSSFSLRTILVSRRR
jgi:hypothetical protein